MAEQEPVPGKPAPPQFGEPLPHVSKRGKLLPAAAMFHNGEELPLFSGTPIPAVDQVFAPEPQELRQSLLPDMPPVDYDHVLAKDKQLRRRTSGVVLPGSATLFELAAPATVEEEPEEEHPSPLHELLAPYVDLV